MNRRAYIFSGILHASVLLALFLKLPFLRARPMESPPIIPIEVVSASDLTRSPPKKVKKKDPVGRTKKETHKAASKKKVQENQAADTKKASKKAAAPTPKPKAKSKSKAPPPLEKSAKKQAPKNDLKVKKQAAAQRKKGMRKKTDDFTSVLQAVHEVQKNKNTSEDATADKAVESEHISDKITLSELDVLRQQLQKCWNVPAGALHAEDLVVQVRVTMGPDAMVKEVKILDESRMQKDGYFRTAAESAKRALFSPECSPLNLPKDRYEQWQTFVITFNPKDL